MRMLKVLISETERTVLELRQVKGYTFRQIAEAVGFKHYQQAQAMYTRTLRKLRVWKYLEKYDKDMLFAAYKFGWTQKKLLRLYYLLDRNGILETYRTLSPEKLLDIKGIGPDYLNFLTAVKNVNFLNPPVVKDEVDEPF